MPSEQKLPAERIFFPAAIFRLFCGPASPGGGLALFLVCTAGHESFKHDKCISLACLLTYLLYLLTGVWCDIGQVHAALVWGVAQEHGSTCDESEVRNPWLLK